jgi:two-component system NtrC family response regulator
LRSRIARDTLADVPLLAKHFLRGTGKSLSEDAAAALQRHSWPGNVRELRSAMRCAASLALGPVVTERHLAIQGSVVRSSILPPSAPAVVDRASLEAVEREAIVQALALRQDNISRAAKALGIHRSTLRRKLRELGLRRTS